MDQYQIVKVAGRGAFGVVLIARSVESKKRVAIKRILLPAVDKTSVARELSALRCLHHPNIVKYIDAFASGNTLSIVTEEVGFTLSDVIDDHRKPRSEDFVRWYYMQMLEGIHHMHIKGVMHRDMKPENVLVTTNNIVKIADFGQACLYFPGDKKREYDENVATRWYRSPELLFSYRKYTPTVDIWAIGCILGELIKGKPLFAGRSDLEQISVIFGVLGTPSKGSWPSWDRMPDANKLLFESRVALQEPGWRTHLHTDDVSPGLLTFLRAHLHLCGEKRPSAATLRRNAWLAGGDVVTPQYRPQRSARRSRSNDDRRRHLPALHIYL